MKTLKFNFCGTLSDLMRLLGLNNRKNRLNLSITGGDEPIERKPMVLEKPIKPGFRRPFTLVPDEPLDAAADGSFVNVEILSGDSTVTISDESTATSIKGWINGDGSLGAKAVRFVADGHVGAGEQVITLDVEFTVAHPDATTLGLSFGDDEPIPG